MFRHPYSRGERSLAFGLDAHEGRYERARGRYPTIPRSRFARSGFHGAADVARFFGSSGLKQRKRNERPLLNHVAQKRLLPARKARMGDLVVVVHADVLRASFSPVCHLLAPPPANTAFLRNEIPKWGDPPETGPPEDLGSQRGESWQRTRTSSAGRGHPLCRCQRPPRLARGCPKLRRETRDARALGGTRTCGLQKHCGLAPQR